MSNSFNENFVFLSIYVETFQDCYLSRKDNDDTTIFHFFTYSWEIIEVFSDLTKTLTLAFGRTLFKGGLSNFA